jgi:hypothetical protein
MTVMNLEAQHHMIFGALCVDEDFRANVFEAGGRNDKAAVRGWIHSYATTNGVDVDESVTDNVMNVVRSASPCRTAAEMAFAAAKAAACPCWPC